MLLSGHVADRQGDKLTKVADRSDKGRISTRTVDCLMMMVMMMLVMLMMLMTMLGIEDDDCSN